eukprot:SAG31_NODE_30724_length_377_cov_0.485612_1_plen_61_part_10
MDKISEEENTTQNGAWRTDGTQSSSNWRSRSIQKKRQTQVEQGQSFGQTVEESIKAAIQLE